MLRRPPDHDGRTVMPTKCLLALAILFSPWLPLVDAQLQHQPQQPLPPIQRLPHQPPSQHQPLHGEPLHENWASTRDLDVPVETPGIPAHASPNSNANKNRFKHILIPEDARALATLAPVETVRAPLLRPGPTTSYTGGSGLSSLHDARSLRDWEVEDFVLLATVDGDLYASDRKTGKELWHTKFPDPMVDTKHYRANNSAGDKDYSPVDHYIWAVEPVRGGELYVWMADDPNPRLLRMPFSMRSLIEQTPYATEDPPVVYTGDKKTTMITLDAATGRVLKIFGSTGSHINLDESCMRPNALAEMESEECSSVGTITLGKTEYTVGIQRRDGRPIAQLKFSEWGPNNRDSDLLSNYTETLDAKYVVSRHDGKVYGFDYRRTDGRPHLFTEKYAAPVATVFDVCRPGDAPRQTNPELIVLPQPVVSTIPTEDMTKLAGRVFINQTEGGSWFAMSGEKYPLIYDAPAAEVTRADWWVMQHSLNALDQTDIDKALVGTHALGMARQLHRTPSLPAVADPMYREPGDSEKENGSSVPGLPPPDADSPTIIRKVKSIPQVAANSIIDFIRNPVLILLFVFFLVVYHKDLRRWYNGKTRKIKLMLEPLAADESSDETDHLPPLPESTPSLKDEAEQKGEETSTTVNPPLEDLPEQAAVELDKDQEEPVVGSTVTLAKPLEMVESNSPDPGQDKEKKKKAHRGQRGGVKHKKGKNKRDQSQSQDDEPQPGTVEQAVNDAKKLGESPKLEPDVKTLTGDMQAVTGPIIKMGNIEVDTEHQLGTGSNGTLVFAGRFDGREVAVKRMLIQFYDIASQETKLLRESDDHPNGKPAIAGDKSLKVANRASYPVLCSASSRWLLVHCARKMRCLACRCC
jgi:serine/threonine-protein kinase/endoribonuclease IRE1